MKKEYLNPTTDIIIINTEQYLLFGSPTDPTDPDSDLNGGGDIGNYEDGMPIQSRTNSIWDED